MMTGLRLLVGLLTAYGRGFMKPLSVRAFLAVILFAPSTGAGEPGWPQSIAIGTASPGGTYYIYGQALADILGGALGIKVTAEATQGSTRNIILLETGQATLGMITMGIGWEAWNGTGEWTKGRRFRAMRAILPMYDSPFVIAVPKRFGLKSLSKLAGKRLGAGPRAGTSGTYFPRIFEALGIPVTFIYGSLEEMASQVIGGQLDGAALATGVPVPALLEIEAKEPLEFIPFTPEQLATAMGLMPELSASTLPRATYPSLTEDYQTVGHFNFVVAHKDLPKDLVYRAVKAVYDNHERLARAHSAAKETVPANVTRDTFLPLHPGAVQYYREIGVDLPAVLEPTD
jgi:TRAP transporter TAXI family solute receptor